MSEIVATCRRCESPIESGDLRCAVCGDVAPFEAERRESTEFELLRCDGCGASVKYDPSIQAPRCTFCGEAMHLEQSRDPDESASLYFEFTVDPTTATGAVKRWLGSRGFFRPSDLRDRARVDSVKPIFWAGWMLDAEALVSYAADTEVGSHRSAWAPCSGQVEMTFENIVAPATRGLRHRETSHLVPSYTGPTAAAPRPPIDGTQLERFEQQRSAARRIVADAIRGLAVHRVSHQHLPGSRRRNVRTECVVRGLVTRRIGFPAYILAYRYENELYRVVVSGQDAGCIIGDSPIAWSKIFLAVGIGLGAVALIAAIIALVVASR
ncbi:MAG: hypothetical protein KDC38_10080 [Planctomycetes bacterium]|nr:hypothetical protein [Planctomycetota bacterium]